LAVKIKREICERKLAANSILWVCHLVKLSLDR